MNFVTHKVSCHIRRLFSEIPAMEQLEAALVEIKGVMLTSEKCTSFANRVQHLFNRINDLLNINLSY